MASGSTCSGRSRRGLISCLHSLNCRAEDAHLVADQELRQAMYRLIVGFYEEAFNRLPCETMPDLLGLLSTGGFCLGLLDPVSNIILNTLALLPQDASVAASSTSPPRPSTKSSSRPGIAAWHEVANSLVQHDLYVEGEEAVLDPESDRTQAALKWAATTTGHPSPSILAQLMAVRLKHGDLDLVEKKFSADGRNPLTAEDVRAIHRTLHLMMTPMCVANISHTKNGLVVHVYQNLKASWSETPPSVVFSTTDARITSTAFCWDGNPISSAVQLGLPDKLQDCLKLADGQKHALKTPCGDGDGCDYLRSLKMYLHGMIHNLYLQALKLLPTPSGSLMRSILKAGHCYGSCDPLSNIILNSNWYEFNSTVWGGRYDTCGSPLPVSDHSKFAQYNDVLDPRSMLRPVVRSLQGLAKLALFAYPQSSTARAMEKLCSAKCNTVHMLLSSARERSEKTNPFHEAAMAAGHPLPLELGELHQLLLLMPDERSALLACITEAETTGGVVRVDEIRFLMTAMWSKRFKAPQTTVQAPPLCVEALRVVSSKRSAYELHRTWLRSKIEQVLKDYTDSQFWGPNYKLDIIFGVEESNKGSTPFDYDMRYHVNFMATSDLNLQRTLFFAELWSSPNPTPEFCCPLPYPYAGRCYYDVLTARKIVYPDDAKYIPDDITHGGTGSVDYMLEMDLVYFSSELDVELAENLNMLPPSSGYDSAESE
ncbi:hypothetical protein ACQ4PT_050471 [Festuca glaucescens]